ncbi:MAG: LD-carboxypeptidase [Acidobacteriota bacterium]
MKGLREGDSIALIAPSSPFDTDRFNRACELLEARGYRLSIGKSVLERKSYLAGTETQRAEDLIEAVLDPDVSAIVCIRGGYGSGRLLPWLPFSRLKNHAKILLGHSDVTFLHAAFHRCMGWTTFHGPNLNGFLDQEGRDRSEAILDALNGRSPFRWEIDESSVLRHGSATGPVLGGNLTCLVHLLGTPYFPDLTGAILVVEDCNEALYRLDRMFTHLKLAGVLDQLGGLVLGQFTGCGDTEKILEMVADRVRTSRFPVVADLPFGHGADNQVIPFGTPFRLNTHEHTLEPVRHPFKA